MKVSNRLASKLSLSLASILAVFLLLEAAMRYRAYLADRELLQHAIKSEKPVENGADVSLRELIRFHPNPRVIYELRPDLSVTYRGGQVTINEHGFRGGSYAVKKPAGTFRILGLGDSVMFGAGVSNDELYLAYLYKRLGREYPGLKIEIINTAVSGYNTAMEIALLEEKGLKFEPDLVLIDYVGNDLDLPNFIRKEQDYWTFSKSFLVDSLERLGSSPPLSNNDVLTHAPTVVEDGFRRMEHDPSRVPPAYRDMVGLESYARAMAKLKRLAKIHGFKVMVCCHVKMDAEVRKVCADLKLPVAEGYQAVSRYLRKHEIKDYLGSVLTLSKSDPHPSPLGHRLFANVLFEFIVASYLFKGD